MINRYSDRDILINRVEPIDHVQIYDDIDFNKLNIENVPLALNSFSTQSLTEYHIYSRNNILGSSEYPLTYSPNQGFLNAFYKLDIRPERDVRSIDVERGNYDVVYNFVDKVVRNLTIDDISADRTEIQLSISAQNDSAQLKTLYDYLLSAADFKPQFALNFGENQLEQVVGITFENNQRVGEIVEDVLFPTTELNGFQTRFYPTDNDQWVEVYRQNSQFLDIPQTEDSPQIQSFQYFTTGRTAKFNIGLSQNGNLYWQQELDGNEQPIFYTHNAPEEDRVSNVQPNVDLSEILTGHPIDARIRYYNNNLANLNGLTNIVVKLYRPLSEGLDRESPSLDYLVRDTYIDRVLVYPLEVEENQPDFSTPNFKLDLGYYGKSQGTSLKSWDDLLDANSDTTNQIIDSNLSSSFGNIKLNINYTDFQDFVKYSSAVERVQNFKYKLELIESYNARISTLESVSGSEAIGNISQSMARRDNVVSGFDGWERWMYYESTGSLYTHYSSSAFTFEPWPKITEEPTTFPLTLLPTTSSTAIQYFNGLLDTASYFDSQNESRLTRTIPVSIVEDDANSDYLLFVDMIGHYFDIVWTYVRAITSVNSREEHPFDGMPNELLYNVASAAGWQLTHTKQRGELWKYFIGTDALGQPIQSGSLASKPEQQMNYEVWRRIVNNIPYLLKTKGTRRSIKALIATYGIPQAFLSIREYGGPVVNETEEQLYWEHDKFVYHLTYDKRNQYIEVPWDKIATLNAVDYTFNEYKVPDGIELQFEVSNQLLTDTMLLRKGSDFAVILERTGSYQRGNIHFYLNGNSYKSASILDVPLFDSKMSTLVVQRFVTDDDPTIEQTYEITYKRSFRDRLTIDSFVTMSVDGGTEPEANLAWTGSGNLHIGFDGTTPGGVPTLWQNADDFYGKIQEIRLWENALDDQTIRDHTLARNMYNGNTHTSSFFDLKFRFIPDSQLRDGVTQPEQVASEHPNQQVSETQNGEILSASLWAFDDTDLVGVTEEYYTRIPSAGANNIMTNKVRIEENRLIGPLNPERKNEISQYDKAPVDTNQVGVYLTATDVFDYDIYNHTGYFSVDDYIGDPDCRPGYGERYYDLDFLRRQVFRKYSTKNLINAIIDILARYDLTVFEQIRQTLPARVDYNSGILIEPHILERPKFKSTSRLTQTNIVYETTIPQLDKPIETEFQSLEATIEDIVDVSSEFSTYETTIDVLDELGIGSDFVTIEEFGIITAVTPYDMATYEYTNLIYSQSADIGFGINWTTSSNGYWNYNVLGAVVSESRVSRFAQVEEFFYGGNELSASFGVPVSRSYTSARVSTDYLPLGYANSKFNGCKMTSDSITANSPDTPDGGPVIERFVADPNKLIYTSETAEEGNLDVLVDTELTTLDLNDLFVNRHIEFGNRQTYNREISDYRRETSQLSNVEIARRAEFDIMVEEQMNRKKEDMEIRLLIDSLGNE